MSWFLVAGLAVLYLCIGHLVVLRGDNWKPAAAWMILLGWPLVVVAYVAVHLIWWAVLAGSLGALHAVGIVWRIAGRPEKWQGMLPAVLGDWAREARYAWRAVRATYFPGPPGDDGR